MKNINFSLKIEKNTYTVNNAYLIIVKLKMSNVPKYIKVNGVLTRNPAFKDGNNIQTTLLPQALVPVTNIQDVARQNEIPDKNQQIFLS